MAVLQLASKEAQTATHGMMDAVDQPGATSGSRVMIPDTTAWTERKEQGATTITAVSAELTMLIMSVPAAPESNMQPQPKPVAGVGLATTRAMPALPVLSTTPKTLESLPDGAPRIPSS